MYCITEGSKGVKCHSNWLKEQPLTAHYKKALSWFQVLLEVELLLRAWRKRTQHAFTAHLQREKDKVKWFTVAIWKPVFLVSSIWMMRAFQLQTQVCFMAYLCIFGPFFELWLEIWKYVGYSNGKLLKKNFFPVFISFQIQSTVGIWIPNIRITEPFG